MRRRLPFVLSLTVVCLLGACAASATDPSTECPDAAPCECPGLDATPIGDAAEDATPDLCAAQAADLDSANLVASLRRFALHRGVAVLEGTFGAVTEAQVGAVAPFTVTKVHRGWRFLEGVTAAVEVPDGFEPASAPGSAWVVAMSQSRPIPWDHADLPWWGTVLTLVPAIEAGAFADVTGYHADDAPLVAVVRVAAQDPYRTTFEVVDALKGTFPPTFADNWLAEWGLPYPAPDAQALYVASVYGLTHYPAEDLWLGSVLDFRRADAGVIAEVKAAIARPALPFDRDALRATRDEILTGFRFYRSATVVASQVTGFAGECCTNAGGTFVEHAVLETLKGDAGDRFVLGGHGYYGDETCGDAFLVGLDAWVDPAAIGDGFDCLDYPAGSSWDAYGPDISSSQRVRLPLTPTNEQKVATWLAASPPLYQLHEPPAPSTVEGGAEVPPEAIAQDSSNAPWSAPHDALEAFTIANVLILFTIDQVTHDAESGVTRVTASSTFSLYEYEHLARHAFQLAFRCGDPRLTQVGSRWVGGLVMLDPYGYDPTGEPNLASAFLIPGALLPEGEVSGQLESDLAQLLN